ncbi:MAG: nucleotidyl transferase AbiEii/AbiGii toxin family protein [Candidatus Saganbacteria bacterium]|nr:nucleotidyl transferase AbiEii/AbiGii toxin family protein [Candidatus Saganbacteria bacterium]
MKDKYPTIFHLISTISKKEGISCVIIGGFAINFYKVTRATADVDFLITKEDFNKILVFLEKAGYKEDYTQKVFTRLKSSDRASLMDVDFMFVDKETLDGIVKEGKEVSIAGQKFMVPSLNHLIALKLHSLKHNLKIRENKDLPDIIDLIRINKINFKGKEFKALCLKYGTEEIYCKIVERM